MPPTRKLPRAQKQAALRAGARVDGRKEATRIAPTERSAYERACEDARACGALRAGAAMDSNTAYLTCGWSAIGKAPSRLPVDVSELREPGLTKTAFRKWLSRARVVEPATSDTKPIIELIAHAMYHQQGAAATDAARGIEAGARPRVGGTFPRENIRAMQELLEERRAPYEYVNTARVAAGQGHKNSWKDASPLASYIVQNKMHVFLHDEARRLATPPDNKELPNARAPADYSTYTRAFAIRENKNPSGVREMIWLTHKGVQKHPPKPYEGARAILAFDAPNTPRRDYSDLNAILQAAIDSRARADFVNRWETRRLALAALDDAGLAAIADEVRKVVARARESTPFVSFVIDTWNEYAAHAAPVPTSIAAAAAINGEKATQLCAERELTSTGRVVDWYQLRDEIGVLGACWLRDVAGLVGGDRVRKTTADPRDVGPACDVNAFVRARHTSELERAAHMVGIATEAFARVRADNELGIDDIKQVMQGTQLLSLGGGAAPSNSSRPRAPILRTPGDLVLEIGAVIARRVPSVSQQPTTDRLAREDKKVSERRAERLLENKAIRRIAAYVTRRADARTDKAPTAQRLARAFKDVAAGARRGPLAPFRAGARASTGVLPCRRKVDLPPPVPRTSTKATKASPTSAAHRRASRKSNRGGDVLRHLKPASKKELKPASKRERKPPKGADDVDEPIDVIEMLRRGIIQPEEDT